MVHGRRQGALGPLALALVLTLASGAGFLLKRSGRQPVALQPAGPPAAGGPVAAAALGWRVDSAEPDPRVWEALPGVGPALAGRLAAAAAEGELEEPADLLRVRGIGARMAADLEPRIRWTGATQEDR